MSWIESHIDLGEHPKLLELCFQLTLKKHEAMGHLHLLWHFAMKYASEDGDLSKYNPRSICLAVGWEKDQDTFINGLRETGWIEKKGFKIHDWDEYTLHYKLSLERAERQREQARERVREWRRRRSNANVTHSNKNVTQCYADTLPNHTLPNIKTKTKEYSSEVSPIPTEPLSPIFLTFKTNGTQKEWAMTEKRLLELKELYPGIDVVLELKKAKDWCDRETNRRKTVKGMERFINSWLGRAQNSFHPNKSELTPKGIPEWQKTK